MGRLRDWRRERAVSKARKRAAKVSTSELSWWVQTALTDIHVGVRENTLDSLLRSLDSTETLYAILQELQSRVR